MSKKVYTSPKMEITMIETMQILAASGVYGTGDWNFGYGGVDDGTHIPD